VTGFSVAGQDSTRVLLVHSRYDPGDTSNEYLIGYHFKQGKFYKQDTILHRSRIGDSDEDGRVSVGLHGDRIFQDRYMFSSIGILVDLWEKKLLWEKSNLSFVKEEGNKLYFSRSFFITTLELYEYDLEKHIYRNVLERPFEGYCFRPELCAPDYDHFLETTYESPGKAAIFLIDSAGKKKKLAVASKMEWSFSGSRANGKMPLAWTDEHHFVFPNYIVHKREEKPIRSLPKTDSKIEQVFVAVKPDSLPCCSVELNEVDIRNGSVRFITTINGLYQPMVDDRIYKETDGDLIFRNRGADTSQSFRINLLTGEIRPDDPWTQTFTLVSTNGNDEESPDDIFFKGNKIGTFYVYINHREDSVLAFTGSRKQDGNESIFVWNTEYRNWQELPIERFLGFFGWINKNED
jgi:hypothetical protein